MAVVRWSDPFRELVDLQERMNRAFEETVGRHRQDEEMVKGTWAPPVDIFETKESIVLKAELAGVKQGEVQLRFEEGILTLEGERRFEKESEDASYHRVERSYGKFARSFSIPNVVDPDGISAAFDGGVLTVTLKKREEIKPKQIRIQIGGAPIDVTKQGS